MPEPTRARSRLRSSPPPLTPPLTTPVNGHSERSSKPHSPVFINYIKHLPTLSFCIPGYLIAGYMVLNVRPAQIQHILIPNAYLPLLLSLGWGHFWLASFVVLNSRRGFLIAAALSLFTFLHLAQVVWTTQLVLAILAFFGILELIMTVWHQLTTRHPAPHR